MEQTQTKPRGRKRKPDHLRPVLVTARLPRDVVAWIDGHRTSRTAVILGLIRAGMSAKGGAREARGAK